MSASPPLRLLVGFHCFGQSYVHVPELLMRAKLPMDAVFTNGHPLRGIKGFGKTWTVPHADWPAAIESALETGDYRLLVNVDEIGLYAIYAHSWGEATQRFLPFSSKSPLGQAVGSKTAFHSWCLANSLPVPESRVFPCFAEAKDFAERHPGRWLIKADRGYGGNGVVAPPYKQPPGPQKAWLAQQDHGHRVGSGVFTAVEGRVLAWVGFRKLVCLREGFGPTVHGTGAADDSIGALCRAIAKRGGITGITGFDYVLDENARPLIIDSHLGRMSPLQHFDRTYGVDLGAALGTGLRGESCGTLAPVAGPDFIKFPELVQLAFEGNLGYLKGGDFVRSTIPILPEQNRPAAISSLVRLVATESRVFLGALRRRVLPGRE